MNSLSRIDLNIILSIGDQFIGDDNIGFLYTANPLPSVLWWTEDPNDNYYPQYYIDVTKLNIQGLYIRGAAFLPNNNINNNTIPIGSVSSSILSTAIIDLQYSDGVIFSFVNITIPILLENISFVNVSSPYYWFGRSTSYTGSTAIFVHNVNTFTISNCQFINNFHSLFFSNSSISLFSSLFTQHRDIAINTLFSSIFISNSNFHDNIPRLPINLSNNSYVPNTYDSSSAAYYCYDITFLCVYYAAINLCQTSAAFMTTNCRYACNYLRYSQNHIYPYYISCAPSYSQLASAVMNSQDSIVTINNCSFNSNGGFKPLLTPTDSNKLLQIGTVGGVLKFLRSNITMYGSNFYNNSATSIGVADVQSCNISVFQSTFIHSYAQQGN